MYICIYTCIVIIYTNRIRQILEHVKIPPKRDICHALSLDDIRIPFFSRKLDLSRLSSQLFRRSHQQACDGEEGLVSIDVGSPCYTALSAKNA